MLSIIRRPDTLQMVINDVPSITKPGTVLDKLCVEATYLPSKELVTSGGWWLV